MKPLETVPKSPLHLWRGLLDWQKNLFLLALTQSIVVGGWSFMSPLYPLFIQQELGVDDPKKAAFWAGLTSAALALSMALFGPFWGYLSDRYGRKPILIRAYLAGGLILLLTGLVTDVRQLIGLRLLHGAISGSMGPAMALGASIAPKNRLALAVGMMQFSTFFAITTGPLVGGLIADAVGFRITYFVASGVVASSAFIVLLGVREKFERPGKTEGSDFGFFGELREVVTAKGVLPALMVIAVAQGAPTMLYPVIPGFIQSITDGGRAIVNSGYAFAVLGLTGGIAALLIGRYSDRLELRAILILSCFGASLAFLSQFFVHSYLIFLLLMGVFGLFSGGMLTSVNSMVGMLIPKQHLGAAFGVVNSANSLAWGLSPFVGGSLALAFGLRRVFPAAAIALAMTGVAVAAVLKGIKEPSAERPQVTTPQTGHSSGGGG